MIFKLLTSVAIYSVFTLLILDSIECRQKPNKTSSTITYLSGGQQNEPQYTSKQFGKIELGELVKIDANTQTAIISMTEKFAKDLISSRKIFVALNGWNYGDYVVPSKNDKQREFWNNKVIPLRVRTLEINAKAISHISEIFDSIGDFGYAIKEAYQMITRSKGRKKIIEISRENIHSELNKLNESIALTEQLNSFAFQSYVESSKNIFEIKNHKEAMSFAEKKEDLDMKIRQHHDEQQKLISDLGKKKGEVERIYFLIKILQEQLKTTTKVDLEASEKRTKDLNKLNDEIDSTIQNIPQKIKKMASESLSCGWWFWKIDWTKTHTLHVDSPNRKSERNYLENVITSRLDLINANKKDENDNKKEIDKMKNKVADFILEYSKEKIELKRLQTSLHENLNKKEREIEKLLDEKSKVEEEARVTFEKIGQNSRALISCLAQLRSFAKSLTPGESTYAPLASILKRIKAMVEAKMGILDSDEPSDISMALTFLIEEAMFFFNYRSWAQQFS